MASKRPVSGDRYADQRPGSVAPEAIREIASGSGDPATPTLTDETRHATPATRRALYRRLAYDRRYLPQVRWWFKR